jgi:hypothetical protein
MDQHEAMKHLDKFRKKWRQKVRGFFDQVFNTNTGASTRTRFRWSAMPKRPLPKSIAAWWRWAITPASSCSWMRIGTSLEQSARQVEKAVNRLGFAARVETINTLDAYLGSLPGHGVENVRRPLINTMNLADLLPTSTIWTGSATRAVPDVPAAVAGAHALRYARRYAVPPQPACARPGPHLHVRPDRRRQIDAPGHHRRAAPALCRHVDLCL